MSKNGSIKEFIFNLILMKNPSLLSLYINGEYQFIELEQYYQQMYIDMYGWQEKNNVPIYVETQLTSSDPSHLEKVKRIIETINEGIVIWIAPEFNEEHVEKLYSLLHFRMAKPINLLTVTFNESYLPYIDQLDQRPQIEIWNKISTQQILLPVMDLHRAIEIIPPTYQGVNESDAADAVTTIKGANKYFLQCLKHKVPFYLNAHRSKANLTNRQIVFGAGRAGLDFVVCLDDLRGNCFIKLRISNDKHSSLYDKMKKAIVQKVKSDSIITKKNEVILFLPNTLNTIDKIQATVQLFGQIITITAPMIYNQKGA